ncbi:MAG: hypothetical protein GC205_12925 [Bacteroidetes bacterium]|nr:hypothetical protein [Bacteroidota bacterium]
MLRLLCFSLLAGLLGPPLAQAGNLELSKRMDTVYAVQPGLRLELDNRYGNAVFSVWDKNQVRVEVNIRVRESDEIKAKETLAGIRSLQVLYGGFLRLETTFDEQSSGIKRVMQSLNPFERSAVDVDYRITLPAYTVCEISNQFGDVYFEGLESPATINLRYGDLRSQALADGSWIRVEYGNAVIGRADQLFATISNSEFELRQSKSLELQSDGSKVRIEQVGDLRLTSRKDNIRLSDVRTIRGQGRFSDLFLAKLEQTCDLEWSLGSIDLAALSPSFGELRFDQRNANVKINVANLGFSLQAYLEGGQLIVPKEITELNVKMLDEKNKIRSLTGRMPASAGAESGKGKFVLRGKEGEYVLYR